MGAYVTFDSLDAGRSWNRRPPGLGRVAGLDEFGCIPPGEDKQGLGRVAGLDEFGCIPPGEDHQGLGQFAFLAAAAPIIGAAISAGGAVGGAMIAANAQKYAIRQQTKTDLQVALARAHSELEQTKATAGAQVEISKETTKQKTAEVEGAVKQTRIVSKSAESVTTNFVPVIGILGAGAIIAWIVFGKKDSDSAQRGWGPPPQAWGPPPQKPPGMSSGPQLAPPGKPSAPVKKNKPGRRKNSA